jgi:hypothetical protein
MDEALIALAGVVVGALLGGTGTYFRLRRDLWSDARANGLVLLAEVQALKSRPHGQLFAGTLLAIKSWDFRREALVKFRRGNYPSGLRAREWLELAGHFEALRALSARAAPPDDTNECNECEECTNVKNELEGAARILTGFARDQAVLPHVVATGVREGWKTLVGLTVLASLIALSALGDLPWQVPCGAFAVGILMFAWWVSHTVRKA